jgi:isoleucyl-tRNA synthetase
MATRKDLLRKTLNLPKTKFPMRANAVNREPVLHARCVTELWHWQKETRSSPEHSNYVLHDGPPYANGSLHIGHFMNKVLKDVVNRYHLMQGKRIDFTPGWDCHGLPIELKALERAGLSIESRLTSAVDIRTNAAQLASEAMAEQALDFRRWGVLADWSGADGAVYVTAHPASANHPSAIPVSPGSRTSRA